MVSGSPFPDTCPLRRRGEGRYNGLTAAGGAADEPRRLPAVDYRTRLQLPLRWHATERTVVCAGSIFGVRQPVGLAGGEGSLKPAVANVTFFHPWAKCRRSLRVTNGMPHPDLIRYPRPVRTRADFMSQQPQGVLIAIDWENIRRGAQLYQRNVRPAELCRAMQDVGRIFGEVAGGKAFGDWSLQADDGREFTEKDIVLYHAPRTSTGKDRSDPAILLEVYEWIRDRDDCGTVILGSGDAGYQVLVDRARLHGRRIVLCAFSRSVSPDMLATLPFFPLEAELGIRTAEHGDVNVTLSVVPADDDAGIDDVLERFVREMNQLEGRLSFVGYSMLCSQWMLEWGMGWNEHECRRLIDQYQDAGIVERHEVVNRNNPDWPTSAMRLVRASETVRRALGFSDGSVSKPVTA